MKSTMPQMLGNRLGDNVFSGRNKSYHLVLLLRSGKQNFNKTRIKLGPITLVTTLWRTEPNALVAIRI